MIYFTADLHFGHKNIIEFMNRPFRDVVEMREGLLNGINRRVKQTDELWILGDFALHGQTNEVKELIRRIVCKHTRFVMGNHDKHQHAKLFEQWHEAYELKWNHQRFYLSHYPLRAWRADYQLHGHEHGGMAPMTCQLDVGVDGPGNGWRGEPWSIEEVVEFVQKRDKDKLARIAEARAFGKRAFIGKAE